MLQNINLLQKEKAEAKRKATELNATVLTEQRDLNVAEQELFDGYMAILDRCNAGIERHAQLAANAGPSEPEHVMPRIRIPHNEDGPTGGGLGRTLSEALSRASIEVREQVGEFVAYLQGRMSASADLSPSHSGGGVPMPSFVQAAIERNFASFTPVVNVCRLLATDDGNDYTVPVMSDSEVAEQLAPTALTGADATVSGDTPPTSLTGPKLSAYKLSSKPVYVPRETLVDSSGDIMGDVLAALVARIMRRENYLYTRGSGSGEAQGFLTGATAFNEASQLDLDVTLDLAYACSALYRPNGVYMMSDATAKYLRKLKTGISGDKRVIWTDANFQTGQPATLHGYPVYINNDMPDISGTGYIAGHEIAFGDFKKFLVRRAENGRAFVYNYPIEAKDGRGLIVFRRSDSKLLVPEAIVKLSVGGS